jgi:hypothetical protein
MTLEQTVEIPASRRLHLDFEVPVEIPVGKAKITITPQVEKPAENIHEAVKNLRGIAKKMGSTLTVEHFLEMKREELRLEEENFQRLFYKKG